MKQLSVTLRLEMLMSQFIMLRVSSRRYGTRITIPLSLALPRTVSARRKKAKALVWRVLFDGEK